MKNNKEQQKEELPKVIFFGHASNDKNVVQVFEQFLLDRGELEKAGWQLVFTDAKEPEYTLNGGVGIWEELDKHLQQTEFFVAFLSESFFVSQWCLVELAVYWQLLKGRKTPTDVPLPPPIPILIDGAAKSIINDSPIVGGRKRLSISVENMTKLVADMRHKGIPVKRISDYKEFCKAIVQAMESRDELRKGVFFDLASRHFAIQHISKNPISFFVERIEYEQTAIKMGMAAKSKLLWTVFQSPLLVVDAYSRENYLMPYDEKFPTFKANRRIRLIIFRSQAEAQAYDLTSEEWHNNELEKHKISKRLTKSHLTHRKSAFEQSVEKGGAELLFTRADLLNYCLDTERPEEFKDDSFLEFACSEDEEGNLLLMETGFSSPFALRHAKDKVYRRAPAFGHVTFYRNLVAGAERRIKEVEPYDTFYGYLGELLEIARSIMDEYPDPAIFVKRDAISTLY